MHEMYKQAKVALIKFEGIKINEQKQKKKIKSNQIGP